MIFVYPDPVLRNKSKKIATPNKDLDKVVKLLEKELGKSKIGVGLSAPQVGENHRVFAFKNTHATCGDDCHCSEKGIQVFINPKIIDTYNKEKDYVQTLTEDGHREDFMEGCLSFPDLYGTVKRWLKVKVAYQVLKNGKLSNKEELLEGFRAIVFQHELDHLDGVLFVDHVKEDNGKIFKQIDGELKEIDIKQILAK